MVNIVVPIKSAWLSKINWTQAISMLAMVGTVFGLDLPPQTQADIVVAIGLAQGVMTWVFKTFFTNTVTPSSVPPTLMRE